MCRQQVTPQGEPLLLSCVLNWALSDRFVCHRRSPTMIARRGTAARVPVLKPRSRSGTQCILPCSSTAGLGCSQATFEPSRHMSLSDSRGIITGTTAWSGNASHRQDIVLPVFLVCTIPHPLTRTSSAHFTDDPAAQKLLLVTSGHSSDVWPWRRSRWLSRPRLPADLQRRKCRRATSHA